MKIDAARNSDEDDIGVLVDQLGDHERRSSTRDIPDAAAAHGDHRRAATGTRVEDRRREGEAPAVTESLVNAGHAEPPFRNCYSSRRAVPFFPPRQAVTRLLIGRAPDGHTGPPSSNSVLAPVGTVAQAASLACAVNATNAHRGSATGAEEATGCPR